MKPKIIYTTLAFAAAVVAALATAPVGEWVNTSNGDTISISNNGTSYTTVYTFGDGSHTLTSTNQTEQEAQSQYNNSVGNHPEKWEEEP